MIDKTWKQGVDVGYSFHFPETKSQIWLKANFAGMWYICWGCMLANLKANFICMLAADIFFAQIWQQFFIQK